MGQISEPRLLYWRIVLVGWGTVVCTVISVAVVMTIWGGEPQSIAVREREPLETIVWYIILPLAMICVILTVPMLLIWVPVFAVMRKRGLSVKWAAMLAMAVFAAVMSVSLALLSAIQTNDLTFAFWYILPSTPVTTLIASCLTWYAFKFEKFSGEA